LKTKSLSSFFDSLRAGVIIGLMMWSFTSCNRGATTTANGGGNATVAEQKKTPALVSGTSNPEATKTRLAELFGLCKTGGTAAAAAYFVYRGPDKNREWKDTYRANDSADRAAVEEGCRRIKGYLDESEGYVFGAVKVEKEPEGQWHVVEVSFQQKGKTKKVLFAFLPLGGQFAVGDID
jgi:hypothetical protein